MSGAFMYRSLLDFQLNKEYILVADNDSWIYSKVELVGNEDDEREIAIIKYLDKKQLPERVSENELMGLIFQELKGYEI